MEINTDVCGWSASETTQPTYFHLGRGIWAIYEDMATKMWEPDKWLSV